MILNDLLSYLTGSKYENVVPKVVELEEKKHPVVPNGNGDEELTNLRESMPAPIFRNLVNAFKTLWGFNKP